MNMRCCLICVICGECQNTNHIRTQAKSLSWQKKKWCPQYKGDATRRLNHRIQRHCDSLMHIHADNYSHVPSLLSVISSKPMIVAAGKSQYRKHTGQLCYRQQHPQNTVSRPCLSKLPSLCLNMTMASARPLYTLQGHHLHYCTKITFINNENNFKLTFM